MSSSNSNVISFGGQTVGQGIQQQAQNKKLLGKCETLTLEHLANITQEMFDNADDTLFALAEKAENSKDQTLYFDSMRIVRLKRAEIAKQFATNVQQGFQNLQQTDISSEPTDSLDDYSLDELTLVDDADLEETIAIRNITNRIQHNYIQDLGAIERRMTHIMNGLPVTMDNNPVGAKNICQSFMNATTTLDIELKISLIILKMFDQQIVSGMGKLLNDINTMFIAAHILPKTKLVVNKSKHSHAGSAHNHAEPSSDNTSLDQDSPESGYPPYNSAGQDVSMAHFQQLLAQTRGQQQVMMNPGGQTGQPGPATQGVPGMPGVPGIPGNFSVIPSETFVSSLSQIQNIGNDPDLSDMTNPDFSLKNYVSQQLQAQNKGFSIQSVNPVDQDVIDIVAMLFEFILDDRNIPTSAKALIARLQIPMLKAAIIDKNFFSTNHHPARILLNELSHAAIGIVDDADEASQQIINEIERIVNIVLDEFKDDLSIFSQLLDELRNFLIDHETREQNIQTRIAKVIKQKEDQALAKQWVEETINELVTEKYFPDAIKDIIQGPWQQVMLHTFLNSGQNSDTWKNQLRFIDVLEWSIQPKQASIDRKKLASIIHQLVGTFRNGLEAIQFPPDNITEVLEQLAPYHIASIKGLTLEQDQENQQGFLFKSQTTQTDPDQTGTDPEQDSMQNTAQSNPEQNNLESTKMEQLIPVQPALYAGNIIVDEIDDTNDYQTNLSLDEIDATIQKMTEELNVLNEASQELESFSTETPQLDEEELDEDEKIILEDIVLAGWQEEETDPESQPQDEYLELARHLEQGKWVEFTDENNRKTRAKLAWKSDLLGEYTFLNWKFDVVADKTLYGLAADLRRGSAMIINDIPLVDRALSAVMNTLTTDKPSQQT